VEWQSPAGLYFSGYALAERTNNVFEIVLRDASYTMKVYDGATKQLKYTYANPDTSGFVYYSGPEVSSIDVNNDGINEIIMEKDKYNPYEARVKILNGSDGQVLYQNNYVGVILYIMPFDIDGDGFVEICIAEYRPTVGYDRLTILSTTSTPIGLKENQNTVTDFKLKQNYPNPFNPTTTIEYSIAKEADVQILLYNEIGQLVKTLSDGFKRAGSYKVTFDGTGIASGVYFYQLSVDGNLEAKKMILIK
jgi:hypothetical protein